MKKNKQNSTEEEVKAKTPEDFLSPNRRPKLLPQVKYYFNRMFKAVTKSDLDLENYNRIEAKRSMYCSRRDLF